MDPANQMKDVKINLCGPYEPLILNPISQIEILPELNYYVPIPPPPQKKNDDKW